MVDSGITVVAACYQYRTQSMECVACRASGL